MGTVVANGSSAPCAQCGQFALVLHEAAARGHVKCLRAALAAAAADKPAESSQSSQATVDSKGFTPLHAAAAAGQPDAITCLLDHSTVPVAARTIRGETAAHVATRAGHLACVKALLGRPPLPAAQRIALLVDDNGATCLHAAVARGDNETALWLVRRFGRPAACAPNADNVLPLHIAAAHGNIEFIRIVTKYDFGMVEWRDMNDGGSTSMLTMLHRFSGLPRKEFVSVVDSRGNTPLHLAALKNRVACAKCLVDMGASATVPNRFGKTPLDIATNRNFTEMMALLSSSVPRNRLKKLFGKGQTSKTPQDTAERSESSRSSNPKNSASARPHSSGYGSSESDAATLARAGALQQAVKKQTDAVGNENDKKKSTPSTKAPKQEPKTNSAGSLSPLGSVPKTQLRCSVDMACQTELDCQSTTSIYSYETARGVPVSSPPLLPPPQPAPSSIYRQFRLRDPKRHLHKHQHRLQQQQQQQQEKRWSTTDLHRAQLRDPRHVPPSSGHMHPAMVNQSPAKWHSAADIRLQHQRAYSPSYARIHRPSRPLTAVHSGSRPISMSVHNLASSREQLNREDRWHSEQISRSQHDLPKTWHFVERL